MISPFATKVYKYLRKVPKGKVTTYKELAKAMDSKAFQAIGQVMRTNPYAPNVPCHRVVSANGTVGGFMGKKSGPEVAKKIKMLRKEGIHIKGNTILDFDKKLFRFK